MRNWINGLWTRLTWLEFVVWSLLAVGSLFLAAGLGAGSKSVFITGVLLVTLPLLVVLVRGNRTAWRGILWTFTSVFGAMALFSARTFAFGNFLFWAVWLGVVLMIHFATSRRIRRAVYIGFVLLACWFVLHYYPAAKEKVGFWTETAKSVQRQNQPSAPAVTPERPPEIGTVPGTTTTTTTTPPAPTTTITGTGTIPAGTTPATTTTPPGIQPPPPTSDTSSFRDEMIRMQEAAQALGRAAEQNLAAAEAQLTLARQIEEREKKAAATIEDSEEVARKERAKDPEVRKLKKLAGKILP